jgi:hypothetical protein
MTLRRAGQVLMNEDFRIVFKFSPRTNRFVPGV